MKTKQRNPVRFFRLYWWGLMGGGALGLLSYLALDWYPELPAYTWANYAFFAFVTLAGLIWIFAGMVRQRNNFFMLAFLTMFLVNLLGGVIFFLIAYRYFKVDPKWFLLPFGVYYALFTIVKVVILVRLGDNIRVNG